MGWEVHIPNRAHDGGRKKYKTLKVKGTWNSPSESEEKILAVHAQVDSLTNREKRQTKKRDKEEEPQSKSSSRSLQPTWLNKHNPPK